MRTLQIVVMIVGVLFLHASHAPGAQPSHSVNVIDPLRKDMEIELALSALPSHLRDDATMYTLNPKKGFEVTRTGTNGFHAFVIRTGPGAFRASWPFTKYPDDIIGPFSFDSTGVNAQMKMLFDVAEMQAQGMQPGDLKRTIHKRYTAGSYRAPARTGVAYMLSPMFRTYQNPEESDTVITMNYPHYMYYAPHVTNADVGGKMMSPYSFIIDPGPHGFIVQGVGQTETAAITKEYESMLTRLCDLKSAYCLTK